MAAGGKQTQSAHACDVSLGARMSKYYINVKELSSSSRCNNFASLSLLKRFPN